MISTLPQPLTIFELNEIEADLHRPADDYTANKGWRDAQKLLLDTRWHRVEAKRLLIACFKMNKEVCDILGRVLGYPWYKDDKENFPDATEADGICVGGNVAESLAEEAAIELTKAKVEIKRLYCLAKDILEKRPLDYNSWMWYERAQIALGLPPKE